jgi:hypothetical protein
LPLGASSRAVIFDRVKREILETLQADSRWLTAESHFRKRVSSCETCSFAGLVPADDGFCDQALR